KKKKRERDPNAPKRAMSSYFLYQNDVRAEMRRRNPNLPYRELTKLVSDQWGNLNTEQKQIYEQEASLHRQIYTSQKAAYE
ncbi:HMG-box, partial [Fistulina hepatica ATCC 64428]